MAHYDATYYETNEQSGDRPALPFYYRFFKSQMKRYGRGRNGPILEYGTGVGHLTKRLVRSYDTYALDISDYALSQVSKHAPQARTIRDIDAIEDASLEGVIALHVMEHIEKPEAVFEQFHRKLKRDGLLVFVVPNPDGLGHKLKKEAWFAFTDETHISLFGVREWLARVEASGFKVRRCTGDGLWDTPYLPRVPHLIQKLLFLPLAAIQVVIGRAFLPPKLSECLIVVASKESD